MSGVVCLWQNGKERESLGASDCEHGEARSCETEIVAAVKLCSTGFSLLF